MFTHAYIHIRHPCNPLLKLWPVGTGLMMIMVWTLNFIPHSGVSCMTGSTWLFQTYSYKEGEKWATHFWLRPFYRQTHKQPWAFHPALKLSFVPFLQPQTPSPYCIVQCWCNQKCTASLYSFAYTTARVKKISFMNPFLCIFSCTTTTLLDSFFFPAQKKMTSGGLNVGSVSLYLVCCGIYTKGMQVMEDVHSKGLLRASAQMHLGACFLGISNFQSPSGQFWSLFLIQYNYSPLW